jgi:mono/diheme cytochrome c family protein
MNRWRLQSVLLAGLLGVPATVAAQTQVPDSLPAGVTARMISDGKLIYAGHGVCYACHGQDAVGAMGPNLADTLWLHSRATTTGSWPPSWLAFRPRIQVRNHDATPRRFRHQR